MSAEPWIQVDDPRDPVLARLRAAQLEPGPDARGRDRDRPGVLLPGRRPRSRVGPRRRGARARPAPAPCTCPSGCSTTRARRGLLEVVRLPRAYPGARHRADRRRAGPRRCGWRRSAASTSRPARRSSRPSRPASAPPTRSSPAVRPRGSIPTACRPSADGATRALASAAWPRPRWRPCASASRSCSSRAASSTTRWSAASTRGTARSPWATAAWWCSRTTTDEVVACVRLARRDRRAGGAARVGHRALRRRRPARRRHRLSVTQMNRILEVDAEERLRVGRARRAQPRPQPGGRATSACTTRPTRRRSRRARSAATSPPTPAARTASRPASPRTHVLALEVVLADGSVAAPRRARARPARLRPARLLRRLRGHDGHRHRGSRCGSRRNPPRRAHAAARLHVDRGRRGDGERDHRRRDRARRARDDGRRDHPGRRGLRRRGYPRDAAAVLLVEVDGLPGGVAPPGRRGRAGRPRARRAHGARRGRRSRARAALEGRASRRSARSPASRPTTTCTTRSCRARSSSTCCARSTRSRDEQRLTMMNVFHAGDGNLHPLIVFDRREPGSVGARARGRRRDPRRVRRRRRRALGRARHRAGEARGDAADLHARRPRRAGAPARRVRPVGAGQPAQDAAARAAAAASCHAGPPKARGSDRRRRSSTSRSCGRRARAEAVAAGRQPHATGRSAALAPPAGAARVRARRTGMRRRRRTTPPTSPSPSARARPCGELAAVLGGRRPGVLRSTRVDPARRSAACSPPALRAPRGSGTGPCATACSRCASSPPTAGSSRAGGPDGEERERLRPPAAARRIVRHHRRARAGDPALPAGPGAGGWFTPRPTRSRAASPPRPVVLAWDGSAPTCCSKECGRRRRRADAATTRPSPTGLGRLAGAPAHRGRISVRPSPALRGAGACARTGRGATGSPRSASAPCTWRPTTADARRRGRAAVGRSSGCCARPARPRRRLRATPGPTPSSRSDAAHRPDGKLRPGRSSPAGSRCWARRMPAPARGVPAGILPVDEDELVACVACGLCLPHCPTYRVTGLEQRRPAGASRPCGRSSDGRARRRRLPTTMDDCVQCRGCEAACPSTCRSGT